MNENKRLSLIERWDIDDKLGASAGVYRCHKCEHRGEGFKCSAYGTIPKNIADGKETCSKYKKGEIDFSRITF